MFVALLVVLAFVGGSSIVYFVMDGKRRQYQEGLNRLDKQKRRLIEDEQQLQRQYQEQLKKLGSQEQQLTLKAQKLAQEYSELARQQARLVTERGMLSQNSAKLETDRLSFNVLVITYKTLEKENRLLKTELRMAALESAKRGFEYDQHHAQLSTIKVMVDDVGKKYLDDSREWVTKSLNVNNYSLGKVRLQKVIERIKKIGFTIASTDEAALFRQLEVDYERVVRAAQAREEQAKIQARIREEFQREREIQEEIEQAARDKRLIEQALQRLLRETEGQHAEEVERLQTQLAEAEARSQRAVSQAQLTKSGHVYVISNIGSFGEGVFKIGMTRRLEPLDRIDELSSSPVPFRFDVHMMISCDDAPGLENRLHRTFCRQRVNRANPRKEFFRVSLHEIVDAVKQHHGVVDYVADPEALDFRASQQMSDADMDFNDDLLGESSDDDAQPLDD